MIACIKYIISVFFLAFVCVSCSETNQVNTGESLSSALYLRIDTISSNIGDNTDVYVFNASGSNAGYFHHKALNVERAPGYVKMSMPSGIWNLVLVGCSESDISSLLTFPVFSAERSGLLMWQTQPEGGLLPDVPEIRTALIDNLTINADQTHTTSASLIRNVAKVRVVLEDGVGFTRGNGHTVSLKNVPTSLSWNGGLYPDKDNPVVSSVPMTKAITFSESSEQGHLKSDTVDFIIPAHKSVSPADISTHKITLAVNFERSSGYAFSKEVEIETVPKSNSILLLSLIANGRMDIKVNIQDWNTVSSHIDLQMFDFSLLENNGTIASYQMNMKQERNWWMTLEDTQNFEFVDDAVTLGQFTASPVNIQVRRKTGGAAMSTKLNLIIAGFDGLYQQYDVTDLYK